MIINIWENSLLSFIFTIQDLIVQNFIFILQSRRSKFCRAFFSRGLFRAWILQRKINYETALF